MAMLNFLTELVKRLRALTLKLLPVEVDTKELTDAASRIISPRTIQTYERAAGDFMEAVCDRHPVKMQKLTSLLSYPTACFKLVDPSCGMPTIILRIMMRILDEASVQGGCDILLDLLLHSAIACEVLARRIVHRMSPERLTVIMSTRYRHLEWDGDQSDLSSALELAIDTNW